MKRIAGFFSWCWEKLKTIWDMIADGARRSWSSITEAWSGGSFWKIALIDIPLTAGVIALTFLLDWYGVGMVIATAIASFFWSGMWPEKTGRLAKHMGTLALNLLGFTITMGLWLFAREIVWALVLLQMPRLTTEIHETISESYHQALERIRRRKLKGELGV